ncbi:MAG: hypothetical protein COT85_02370 [Chlamydiae bacterium CG10_big_fil_rev_8_21_14_0_10_42_34]|nr:MAG: hypothetical protein COT85_02370 [Chlamydiae bacterium CG10_big_fil_rev_8_21_14_0_10_42_34]
MFRTAFLLFFLAVFVPGSSMTKTSSEEPILIEDDSANYDENGAPYWTGPGMYWGIHINNEDEYWRHYNQRYPKQNQVQPMRRAGDGRRGVRGDEGVTRGRQ